MSKKSYLLGLYEKALPASISWNERLQLAHSGGFDYMELSIDETDARLERLYWNAGQRNDLALAAADNGMEFGSMCLSAHRKYPLGSASAETRRRSMDIMERALDLSCCLGIRMIQLAGYDVYYEESTEQTREYFRENLENAVHLAARYGVVLGFETMETPFMDTVEKAMAYVKDVNSPYLQVYPDLGNLTNAALLYGTAVTEDLETGAGHLVAAHIKETRPGAYRDIPFGTGHVNFEACVGKAWDLGVRRFVTELWYTDEDPQAYCQANHLARGILDRL